jgi:hypothetical protein
MATAKAAVITVTAAMAAVRTMPSTIATVTAAAMAPTAMAPTVTLSLSSARTRNQAAH